MSRGASLPCAPWLQAWLGMRKPNFQCNANREVATKSPRFCNIPHLSHVLFVKVVPGTTFTSWSKHPLWLERPSSKCAELHTVTASYNRDLMSCSLLICATWGLFFAHIQFVVNRTFTTMLIVRLQHWQQSWVGLFDMTESQGDNWNANWENLDTNNLQSNLLKQHWAPFSNFLGTIS